MADVIFSPRAASSLADPVQRVYLLYGEDDHQKNEALAAIRAVTTDSSFADFDVEFLDGESAPPDTIFAAAGLMPFGSPFRLVVIKNADAFRSREKQATAERIAHGMAKLGPSTCLVMIAGSDDETLRGKTILTAKLDAAVRSHGTVVRCRPLTQDALSDWLIAEATKADKRLTEAAAHRLIAYAHGERAALSNELAKAICYAGDRPDVSIEDVEAVCSYDAEDVMFKLVDAVSLKNSDRALTLLREILRFDAKPQSVAGRLLALLSRQFRYIWQARELIDRRCDASVVRNLPPEIANELPTDGSIASMSWKAGDLFRAARNWTRASLTWAFDAVLRCDLANKGGLEGTENVVVNLELLIVELCAAR